jgi:hypothetical protein
MLRSCSWRRIVVISSALALAGCAPALDWREVRAQGTALTFMLPCKPQLSVRSVQLAGQAVRMSLLACKAAELTWGLGFADVGEPARLGPALRALRESTAANLQAQVVRSGPAAVRGATPHDASVDVQLRGRRPDGPPSQGRLAVFAHGTQVFQATVLGESVPDEAAETFFLSLRIGS